MQKNLVIVESPAKAKTIGKFLGDKYEVLSSYGHIRDLKDKGLGIDIKNNYQPLYEISPDKVELVKKLKKEAKDAPMIWLASDEDREGEAIAWHLYEVLGLDDARYKRIVFHEITKDAILNALENPRKIDYNLVDAQQARRELDRIVGFELSPILWRKIRPSLSAGRVQSVAVRLIVDREREINNFKPEESYRVLATFVMDDGTVLNAELNRKLKTYEEALQFVKKLKEAAFKVENIVTKPGRRSPAPPFTTSTLQQEASRKLGFPVGLTMSVAQRLYESGSITYMRTDSVNLSGLAIHTSKDEIEREYGKEYVKSRQYTTKTKGAQEAHEAIRPTYMKQREIKGSTQEKKLYELIWKRTIASQMADARLEKTLVTIGIEGSEDKFCLSGEVVLFDGFLRVYFESSDEEIQEKGNDSLIPPLKAGTPLELEEAKAEERWSQRPPRYTEASLVRKLEELGIGRPSTYAPIISTIQNRGYVEKGNREGSERKVRIVRLKSGKISESTKKEIYGSDSGKLIPTDTGMVVNDFLIDNFSDVMDFGFTANVEKDLDKVAEGEGMWTQLIDQFYKKFHPTVEAVASAKTEHKVGERILGNDPASGKPVSVKIGRFGPFAQIGQAEDEEKPKFASLLKGQSIETIGLEDALKLFDLPREVGKIKGEKVVAGVGRFGPFVKYKNLYVSIPKDKSPFSITIEEAEELIREKEERNAKRLIKTFPGEGDMQLLNGRFGPYLVYNKQNYRLPKDSEPDKLSYEDCLKIVESDTKKKSKSKSKSEPLSKTAKAKTAKAAGKSPAKAKTVKAKTAKARTAKATSAKTK